jgi:hypothetical protein
LKLSLKFSTISSHKILSSTTNVVSEISSFPQKISIESNGISSPALKYKIIIYITF